MAHHDNNSCYYDYDYNPDGTPRRPQVRFSEDDNGNQPPPMRRPRLGSLDRARRRRLDSDDESRSSRFGSRVWDQPGGPSVAYREMPRPVPRHGGRRVAHPYLGEEAAPVRPAEPLLELPMRFSQSPPPVEDVGAAPAAGRPTQAADDDWDDGSSARSRSLGRARDDQAQVFRSGDAETYMLCRDRSTQRSRRSRLDAEDMDALDDFDFTFDATEPPNLADLSDSDSPGETETIARTEAASLRAPDVTGVYLSRYTGDAELGGAHSATLTVLHDPKGRRRPLSNWLHLRQEVMDFDEFWAETSRQVRFTEAQMAAIAKLRADVKRHCVKSRQNPKGHRVGYMEPRYLEVPLKPPDAAAPASARWICIPYFSLQRYAGLLAASSPTAFPPQTLLQAQYSRTTEQRDMHQAVCQLGTVPRGECFHIAQLWCLVLDNTVLVTCGSMPQAELYSDALTVHSQPLKEPTGSRASGRVLVSYGSAVVWAFDVQACLTWFAFLSHFNAFWPRSLEFTYKNRVVNAETWQQVLSLASRPRGSVLLRLKTIPRPEPPRAVLKPESVHQAVPADYPARQTQTPEYLHVLTLRPADALTAVDTLEEASLQALTVQLDAAEKFLTEQTSYSRQRAYKSCSRATRADVYAYLADQAVQVKAQESDSASRSYEDRIDTFNAADDVFQLFLPREFRGPTTGEYWGSVRAAVAMPDLEGGSDAPVSPSVVPELRAFLRAVAQDIQVFQRTMAYADETERAGIDLPRQFVTAWLHVLSGMTSSGGAGDSSNWLAHMAQARVLVGIGMQTIMQGLTRQSLLDKAVVLPLEMVSLVAMGLLRDQVGKADDITETYSQLLNSLETDITTKPSDRTYENRIELVQQEMGVIRRTMARQRLVVDSIRGSVGAADGQEGGAWPSRRDGERREAAAAGPSYRAWYDDDYVLPPDEWAVAHLEAASKLSPTDRLGFRGLLLGECARIVEQRQFEFGRYGEYAADLQRTVAFKMAWTKDRQESAIFAFTVVTIVFLPLSSISSIVGVRDMGAGQWVYWAIAAPVTLVILVGGLWWMNGLDNVLRWVVGRRRPGAGPGLRRAAVSRGPEAAAAAAAAAAAYYGPPAPRTDAPYAEARYSGRYPREPPAQRGPRLRQGSRSVYRY